MGSAVNDGRHGGDDAILDLEVAANPLERGLIADAFQLGRWQIERHTRLQRRSRLPNHQLSVGIRMPNQ
jgi:hypothetical protein